MQINVERIDPGADSSFRVYSYGFPEAVQAFHVHEEWELAAVEGAGGVLSCGAATSEFASGDLFLFGGRLPHRFVPHPGRIPGAPATGLALVAQFRFDALGADFFRLPENAELRELLEAADAGLAFRGRGGEPLSALLRASGSRRVTGLLTLLTDLADDRRRGAVEALTAGGRPLALRGSDAERLSRLQDYIESAFADGASVDGAADRLALTRTSFCRYVRRTTGRTFTDLLNDYRLTVASMLLRDPAAPVSRVSADAGFGSLSHFNARFKGRFGMTPGEFRSRAARS